MANLAVRIYESVQTAHGKKKWVPVEIPSRKPNGSLYLKHNRHGDFYIRWYQGLDDNGRPRQRWKQVKGMKSLGPHPNLEHAIAAAEAKAWELQHPERVKVEVPVNGRLSLSAGIYSHLDDMSNNAARSATSPVKVGTRSAAATIALYSLSVYGSSGSSLAT